MTKPASPSADVARSQETAEKATPVDDPVSIARPESSSTESAAPTAGEAAADPVVTPQLIVYYFHRTMRCTACLQLEEWAAQAVNAHFPNEVAAGLVQWQALNVDLAENRHFVDEYNLESQSLVLVRPATDPPEWKNLDRIWEYAGDPGKLMPYVEDEVAAYLNRDQQTRE